MKKIIYRKLAKDCLNFFLISILTLSIIIWVLQAVNFLDFVIEDGHGFLVYFKYTLLSFPKILSRVFPFVLFLSFSYILLKYENKNELVIFWNYGIQKINFINFFIKLSLYFVLISLLLNAFITPFAQNKAKSYLRSSDLDFFESILKPKKFIDVIGKLTIYFEEKNDDGELKNIFINDKKNSRNSQTTFAKKAVMGTKEYEKILVLYDGKTINKIDGKISEFQFSKSEYNISKFGSNTLVHQKTQEMSTSDLVGCLLFFKKSPDKFNNNDIINCSVGNLNNIYKELYTRLVKPLYLTFLMAVSLLIVIKSKSDPSFNINRYKIYLFAFVFIIFLESSSKLVGVNLIKNSVLSILPFIFTLIIYMYFLIKLKVNKK